MLSNVHKALSDFEKHLEMIKKTTELLVKLTEALNIQDQESVKALSEQIAHIEREADDLRRSIEWMISKGEVFLSLREDYLRLIDRVDKIASAAKDAARTISLRKVKEAEMEELLRDGFDLTKMAKGADDIVVSLINAIHLLNIDYHKAFEKAHEVEREEEGLDDIKLELLRKLHENEDKISPLTYTQLREFILQIDQIADYAEDAADVVAIMVTKVGA